MKGPSAMCIRAERYMYNICTNMCSCAFIFHFPEIHTKFKSEKRRSITDPLMYPTK